LRPGLNTFGGAVVNKAVAEALGRPHTPVEDVLSLPPL
jgi:hypothetical protein